MPPFSPHPLPLVMLSGYSPLPLVFRLLWDTKPQESHTKWKSAAEEKEQRLPAALWWPKAEQQCWDGSEITLHVLLCTPSMFSKILQLLGKKTGKSVGPGFLAAGAER